MEQLNSKFSLDFLETRLREIEEDIQEPGEEIERQKQRVRLIDEPFKRRYAEHVLASYQEQKQTALAQHLEISNRVSEKRRR